MLEVEDVQCSIPENSASQSATASVAVLALSSDEPIRFAHHFHTAGATTLEHETPEIDSEGNPYVEILFEYENAKLILDEPPPHGYTARYRFYLNQPMAQPVIEEEGSSDLKPQDWIERKEEIRAAVREGLMIWIKHGCFERAPRTSSKNVLDVRWVGKFKWVKKDTSGAKVQIIRMRMTQRGFKTQKLKDCRPSAAPAAG